MTVFAHKQTSESHVTPRDHIKIKLDTDSEPSLKRHKGDNENRESTSNQPEETHESRISQPGHGPLFRALPPHEREALMRLHKNLGHPDLKVFRNTLTTQGWSKEIIKGIEDMHCPACHEVQQPKLSRPSHLTIPRQFNEVVSIDEVIWTSKQGNQFAFYHILDSATNFQVAFPVENRTSQSVWKGIRG